MANLNEQWRGYLWYYAPLIFWIIVIFVASSNTGSMSNTSRIIRPILEFLFPAADEAFLQTLHGYIRKGAHLSFYAILGFLAARAFTSPLAEKLRKIWFAWALILVVVVASIDETNQSFLSSRTGSPYDVLLDVFGGFAALLLFHGNRNWRHSRKTVQN